MTRDSNMDITVIQMSRDDLRAIVASAVQEALDRYVPPQTLRPPGIEYPQKQRLLRCHV